jgi:hypothetical protein
MPLEHEALIDRFAHTANDPDSIRAALYFPSVYLSDRKRLTALTSGHQKMAKVTDESSDLDQRTRHPRFGIFDRARFHWHETVPCC